MDVKKKHPKLRFVGNKCPRANSVQKTFASYVEGGVSERRMDDIESHILKCDPCRKAFLDFTAKLFGKRPPIHNYLASLAALRQGSSNSSAGQPSPSETASEAATKEDDFVMLTFRLQGQNRMSSPRLLLNKAA